MDQIELIESKGKRIVQVQVKKTRPTPEYIRYQRLCVMDNIKPMQYDTWNKLQSVSETKEPENIARWENARSAPTLWDKIENDPVFANTLKLRTDPLCQSITMSNR